MNVPARPDEVRKELSRLFRAIERGKLTKAKRYLARAEDQNRSRSGSGKGGCPHSEKGSTRRMKRIIKNLEPEEFTDWKARDRMAHRPRWNRVPGVIRTSVKRSLMQEQGFICCYCESRISINDCHVEHFRPIEGNSGRYSDQQLIYENLHCSCQGETDRGEPRHCGHGKRELV